MAGNYTEHYQLSQWQPQDRVLRTEFNQDNARLDSALNQLAGQTLHVAAGVYTGTGLHGSGQPNTLTFEFAPMLVIIVADHTSLLKTGTVLVTGQTRSPGIGTAYSSGSCLDLTVTWSGNSVSWYAGDEERQLNEAEVPYRYFALG